MTAIRGKAVRETSIYRHHGSLHPFWPSLHYHIKGALNWPPNQEPLSGNQCNTLSSFSQFTLFHSIKIYIPRCKIFQSGTLVPLTFWNIVYYQAWRFYINKLPYSNSSQILFCAYLNIYIILNNKGTLQ